MSRLLLLLTLLQLNMKVVTGQDTTLLVAGPMLGYVEHREALVWIEVSQAVRSIDLKYYPADNASIAKTIHYTGALGEAYNPEKVVLENLDMNTEYVYEIYLNNKKQAFSYPLHFKTKDIWEYRRPAPDFSFLFGSCAYINDPPSDRPGEVYGLSPRIFDTMAKVPADFMLWLGDNTYTREADYTSRSGFYYRYTHTRKCSNMQHLLASRPNFAIWDDHDYGPNDAGSSFELKDVSLQTFKDFWGNKSYGEPDNPGVYTKFTWSDCDFFLIDDRYYRSDDVMNDSSSEKQFMGDRQFSWLVNNLLYSKASFKFLVFGSQVLNPLNDFESFRFYRKEYDALLKLIRENGITGVVLLSGDRHFSEIIKVQPEGLYPLYDITGSAFTSRSYAKFAETKEFKNPYRVVPAAVTEQNFIKVTISGGRNNRVAGITAITADNKVAWQYEIRQAELKW
ncbi:MAG: alkaline phosphatase family protein [Chitinophagales bacterium]|nr:alkaline phosphatase family protein [Chitinophagales bacterium]